MNKVTASPCRRALHRVLAITLAVSLLLTLLPMTQAVDDVAGHWAESVLRDWMSRGLLNGYRDGSVKPDAPVTRAELCAMINRVFSLTTPAEIDFDDVPRSHWAYSDIAIAVGKGYAKGDPDGKFRPDDPITREEAAVMLARLLELTMEDTSYAERFLDSAMIPEWARGAVSALLREGLMTGYGDNTFGAGRSITRAESVTLLDRARRYSEAASTPSQPDEKPSDTQDTPQTPSAVTPPASTRPSNPGIIPPQPIDPSQAYITKDGVANGVIMLSPNATEMEIYAAQELQTHIELVSGARLNIIRDTSGNAAPYATMEPAAISAVQAGYYTFTVLVTNPTNADVAITLSAEDLGVDAPAVELSDTFLTLPAQSYAEVGGLVTVGNDTLSGIHTLDITVTAGGSTIETLELSVEYAGANLLSNPGFEDISFSPWWPVADLNGATDADAHSGSKSMFLRNARSGYNVGILASNSEAYAYELTFWARRAEGTPDVHFDIVELDSNNAQIRTAVKQDFTLTDEWAQYTTGVFFVNPSKNDSYKRCWFNYNLFGDETGMIYMDDFVLRCVGTVEGYTPAVSSIPEGNLLNNSGFEIAGSTPQQAAGYNFDNNGADNPGFYRFETDDAISGSYVIKYDFEKLSGQQHLYHGSISLKKGYVYRFGADAKKIGDGCDAYLDLCLTALPTSLGLGTQKLTTTSEDITQEWQRFEVEFVASDSELEAYAGAHWPDYFVRGSAGVMYLDNLTLIEVGPATEYTANTMLRITPSVKDSSEYPGTLVPLPMPEKPQLSTTEIRSLGSSELKLYVATTESLPKLTMMYPYDASYLADSDGFAIRKTGNTVYIFGTIPRGALNGVYDFLEDNAGILWTRSIELGTLYDVTPSIPLTHVNYAEKSPFEVRGWHLCGSGAGGESHSDPATEIMMARNKLNAKFAEFSNMSCWTWQQSIGLEPVNMGHNLHYWLTKSPYYQSLSEDAKKACWNTDNDGNSKMGASSGLGQLNFWNPDVAIAIAQSVNAFLDVTDIRYVGVGMEDTASCVQKPEDTLPFEYADGEFVQPDDPKYLSTVFFTFLNDVARRVKAEHPDVIVTTYAYLFTETPPKCSIEDNVAILIAPIYEDMKLPLTDPDSSANRKIVANMDEWVQKTENILVYNYYGCFPYAAEQFERPIADRIQSDLQYYVSNGFMGLLPEGIVDNGTDTWAISTLTLWLYSKLAWDPNADIDALTNLFCEKAYGEAAQYMREYYRLLLQTWDENYTALLWNATLSSYVKTFYSDPEHNALMQAQLDAAWEVADDTVRQRIAPIRDAFMECSAFVSDQAESVTAKRTTATQAEILAEFDMSSDIWSAATPATRLLHTKTGLPVEGTETRVRLLWNDTTLFVAYENFDDRMSELVAAGLNSAGNWWSSASDDVETYIGSENPKGNPNANFRVFFTNPDGDQIVYEAGPTYVADPGEWSAATKLFDDRWVVIQAIPFTQLGIESVTAGTTLFGYFYREFNKDGTAHYIGWNGSHVWQYSEFQPITLVD